MTRDFDHEDSPELVYPKSLTVTEHGYLRCLQTTIRVELPQVIYARVTLRRSKYCRQIEYSLPFSQIYTS